ncbi:hypothetical protein FHW58_003407 [Duganella sp. 1224]|uniref:head-tail joining protein n=1 Tax=Duganella sp. 1224 TaxID=2587052 RepID=UPI0015CBF0E4|nr:hypothetical protein [Duganella sp. 1224]NYE62192.1 hypothetical protein [Duganella sp. 1224]
MFEALEARLNAAAMKKLSNATARIDGIDVRVIFDAQYKVGMVGVVGMGASEPQMVIADSDIPSEFIDTVVSVDGAAWKVVDVHADKASGPGLSLAILEKA